MLTKEKFQKIISYNPESGICTRKITVGRWKRGYLSGTKNQGYIRIGIDYKNYYIHRLAFLDQTGEWPKGKVNHKNNDYCDNRFCNLTDKGAINE